MNDIFYVFETPSGGRFPLKKQQYNKLVKITPQDEFVLKIEQEEKITRYIFKKVK